LNEIRLLGFGWKIAISFEPSLIARRSNIRKASKLDTIPPFAGPNASSVCSPKPFILRTRKRTQRVLQTQSRRAKTKKGREGEGSLRQRSDLWLFGSSTRSLRFAKGHLEAAAARLKSVPAGKAELGKGPPRAALYSFPSPLSPYECCTGLGR
jgi:hypothetical protein